MKETPSGDKKPHTSGEKARHFYDAFPRLVESQAIVKIMLMQGRAQPSDVELIRSMGIPVDLVGEGFGEDWIYEQCTHFDVEFERHRENPREQWEMVKRRLRDYLCPQCSAPAGLIIIRDGWRGWAFCIAKHEKQYRQTHGDTETDHHVNLSRKVYDASCDASITSIMTASSTFLTGKRSPCTEFPLRIFGREYEQSRTRQIRGP